VNNRLRVICIGDVVGVTGRAMLQKYGNTIKREMHADIMIVNGENSSERGRGITSRIVRFLRHNGADVITSGNHIWNEREIYNYLEQHTDLLRPANFPSETPGIGVTTITHRDTLIGVVNIQGRVFMREHVACPFKTIDTILSFLKDKTKCIIVDFHAETTSEKAGFGYYVDGRVSAVVGTHTHVQTADERILDQGTAFITDLGLVGSLNSMLGMKKDPIIKHLITQMPVKFEVETSHPVLLSGVVIDIDIASGKALAIERIRILDDSIQINSIEEK
jgi:metallophosphoesterase (TIGR00282 family)